jgi:hypothetical protein
MCAWRLEVTCLCFLDKEAVSSGEIRTSLGSGVESPAARGMLVDSEAEAGEWLDAKYAFAHSFSASSRRLMYP